MGTATIHLDKVEGSFDETITLLVSGGKLVVQIRGIYSFQRLKFNTQSQVFLIQRCQGIMKITQK